MKVLFIISKPIFSVQFHPEARAGPTDTSFYLIFLLKDVKKNLI